MSVTEGFIKITEALIKAGGNVNAVNKVCDEKGESWASVLVCAATGGSEGGLMTVVLTRAHAIVTSSSHLRHHSNGCKHSRESHTYCCPVSTFTLTLTHPLAAPSAAVQEGETPLVRDYWSDKV